MLRRDLYRTETHYAVLPPHCRGSRHPHPGSTEADEHARARASGADEVLVKPLSLQVWAEVFAKDRTFERSHPSP
jgi:hypothetical protein